MAATATAILNLTVGLLPARAVLDWSVTGPYAATPRADPRITHL
jgi:hypothetical protein